MILVSPQSSWLANGHITVPIVHITSCFPWRKHWSSSWATTVTQLSLLFGCALRDRRLLKNSSDRKVFFVLFWFCFFNSPHDYGLPARLGAGPTIWGDCLLGCPERGQGYAGADPRDGEGQGYAARAGWEENARMSSARHARRGNSALF
jgi:hypothetical protein